MHGKADRRWENSKSSVNDISWIKHQIFISNIETSVFSSLREIYGLRLVGDNLLVTIYFVLDLCRCSCIIPCLKLTQIFFEQQRVPSHQVDPLEEGLVASWGLLLVTTVVQTCQSCALEALGCHRGPTEKLIFFHISLSAWHSC